MPSIRAILTCVFLLCLPTCWAQSSLSSKDRLYASRVTKSLTTATQRNNTLLFRVEGHRVLCLLHSRYQKIQLIYIFPDNPDAADCKAQLTKVTDELHTFFLPKQNPALIYIHEDARFAQIRVEATPDAEVAAYSKSPTNMALKMLRTVGNPQDWKDNRLIWQIPFNNNRSCLELALDVSPATLKEFDFTLRGSNATTKLIIETVNRVIGLNLRSKEDTTEGRTWRSYTGFSTTELLAAAPTSSYSNTIRSTSLFLVKKGRTLRVANSGILQHSNRDESTWVQSTKHDFPSDKLDLAQLGQVNSTSSSSSKPSSSSKTTPAASTPALTPLRSLTPGLALEKYIRQLQSK